MLTCQQMTELVTEFLEGELPWRDWLRFQMHVGMCTHCRTHLGQMKGTISVMGSATVEEMPSEVRDELMERFRNWKAPEPQNGDS